MAEQLLQSIDDDTRLRLAEELRGQVRALLDRTDRSDDDDERMIHAAHAAGYLWLDVGTATDRARAHWQVSRVYAVLGHSHEAHHHARRCLALCEDEGLSELDRAYAHEALARAVAIPRMRATARGHIDQARELAEAVPDDDDRRRLLDDLAEIEV